MDRRGHGLRIDTARRQAPVSLIDCHRAARENERGYRRPRLTVAFAFDTACPPEAAARASDYSIA